MLVLDITTQFGDTNYLIDVAVGAAGSEIIILSNLAVALNNGMGVSIPIPINIPAGSRIAARCQDNFGGSIAYMSGRVISGSFLGTPPCHTLTTYGAVTTTSSGTIANAGGTANTKGAWTQLVSATTQEHSGLIIAAVRPVLSTVITADWGQVADIGVGAAAAEQVLVPDLRSTCSKASQSAFKSAVQPGIFMFPQCDIPAGVRLAVRQQATTINASDRQGAYIVYGLN